MKRCRHRLWTIRPIAAAAIAIASASAIADDKLSVTTTDGLMSFPNVRVVNVTPVDATAPAAAAPIEVTQLADGAVGVKLNEAYMSHSIIEKDASGEITIQCLSGESAADDALHSASVDPGVRHEH
jgi:hypothetical protein